MKLIGIGALIDASWDHYRTHHKTLLKFSAWLLALACLNVIAILLYPIDAQVTTQVSVSEKGGIILLLVNNLVFALILGTWMVNALITAIHAQTGGTKTSIQKISLQAWKLVLPQLFVRLLQVGLYAGALALPFLLFWFITNVGTSFLPASLLFFLLFVALLLLLPAGALAIYLGFPAFALAEDGLHGLEAIRESVARVRGRFWSVTARLCIPKLLYFGIFFLLQFLLVVLIRIIGYSLFQESSPVASIRIEWIALTLSYAALFVFLNPMLLISDSILYNSLKK